MKTVDIHLQPVLLKGNLIQVSDRDVKIELLGRMGIIILPRRSVVSNSDLREGQEVQIYLSCAQVID